MNPQQPIPRDAVPLSKDLTFVMPFENDADTPNRLYKLIYLRFKHIIESKINFNLGDGSKNGDPVLRRGKPCQFNVSAVLARKDAHILTVLEPIRDSDVAIGFVPKTDVTVVSVTLIYELAVRHLLRSGLVLAIDGPPEELRPHFMRSLNSIVLTPSWMQDEDLRRMAERADLQPLDDFETGLNDDQAKKLGNLSDANDGDVEFRLRRALQAMMDGGDQPPDEIRKLMRDLDPEFMVSTSRVFYPAQITRITWGERKKGPTGAPLPYREDDLMEVVVCDWNDRFLELFNIDQWDADESGLTAETLGSFLEQNMDVEDYLGFDVQLASGELPTEGRRLIVVANSEGGLRFRIFDGEGRIAADADEKGLKRQARQVADLRKQLEGSWASRELTVAEKGRVVSAVTSIVGYTGYRSYARDQQILWDKIVYGPQAGVAQVPIRFNDNHPNETYRRRSFLPCCVLKKRVGNPAMEHYLYLFTIFFDVTSSTNLIGNPNLIGEAVRGTGDGAALAPGPAGEAAGGGRGTPP